MKRIKLIILLTFILLISGCTEKNNSENSNIMVSAYPVEYITERLYGKHATIKSIYPDSMDDDYTVSDKLLNDYSKTDLFIFNGNEDIENDYVYKMTKNNKKIKIINSSASLNYNNKIEELWLDPMNYLTIANNIKKGFKEYTTATYLNDEIDKNYEELKLELIKLEADYREMANRANKKNIVVGDDLFLYLSKYGLNVISLEDNKNLQKKSIYNAEELIKNEEVKYIYVKKGQKLNDTITRLKETYNVEIVEVDTFYTISSENRKNGKDYFTLMYDMLEQFKQQLYN